MKGQSSIEFLIYSSVFLLLLLGAFVVISSVQKTDINNKYSLYVRWVGERYMTIINYAINMPVGMKYKVYIDKDIFGNPYTFKIYSLKGKHYILLNCSIHNQSIYYLYPLYNKPILFGDCISYDEKHNAIINPTFGNIVFKNENNALYISQEGCR